MEFFATGQDCYWFGRVKNISPGNDVELIIHVVDKNQPVTIQKDLILDFADNYDTTMTMLYEYMRRAFAKAGDKKTIDEVRRMYFLSAVGLQKDNKDWWVVFEPALDVQTNYNFLPRFTIREKVVVWSNLM